MGREFILVVTTKNVVPQSNQSSEYLAQRRKGRKEIKLQDLAFLAAFRLRSRQAWREQIPVLDSHGPPENLGKLRKLSSNTKENIFANFAFSAVINPTSCILKGPNGGLQQPPQRFGQQLDIFHPGAVPH
jgi:hypothetical protein